VYVTSFQKNDFSESAILNIYKAYHECLHLLEQAAAEHEALKGECQLRIVNVFLKLEKPAVSLEFYLKARVLGAIQIQFSTRIKNACHAMLQNSDNEAESLILNNLIEAISI
jgi:hypothetical protein